MKKDSAARNSGLVFNIQRYSIHDGPGIRTLVFMKGCPLRCFWCSNPESQEMKTEYTISETKCIGCGKCIAACPAGAILVDEKTGKIIVDRETCKIQGICEKECVKVCPSKCREIVGKWMTVEEVMKEVEKDAPFYKHSGGGITVGGGEPLMQADFVSNLLKTCKERGLHTALETCGYAKWEDMKKILDYTDWLFFDIKHMSADKHQEGTGKANKIILENLEKVAHYFPDLPLAVRTCLVAGYNSSEADIEAAADFLSKLGKKIEYYELLLYHRLGESKYKNVGRQKTSRPLEAPSKEHAEALKQIIESYGLTARVA